MRHLLSAAAAVAIMIFGGMAISPNVMSAEEEVVSSCSVFETAGCCACNEEQGTCIEVEHSGVASCTFEFCSDSSCIIIVD